MNSGILSILYGHGPHPAHKYQFEIIKGDIVYLWKNILPSSVSSLFKPRSIVFSEGFRPSIYACLLKSMGLAKLHVNILFGDFIMALMRKYLFESIKFLYQHYVDYAVASSSLTYELARSKLGMEKEKLFISWPVSHKSHLFKSIEHEKIGENLSICFLGHITSIDGADLLQVIYYRLKEEEKNVVMYVIGGLSSKEPTLFRDLLKFSKREEGFRFLGSLPDEQVREVFAKCTFFVYPARFKAFGLPVVEAMAAGIIPIVTRNVGARDFVVRVSPELVVHSPLKITDVILEIYNAAEDTLKYLSSKAKHIALSYDERAAKKRFSRILRVILSNADKHSEIKGQ